jgi:formylglycine-generating enzyme required for sulfatase activity
MAKLINAMWLMLMLALHLGASTSALAAPKTPASPAIWREPNTGMAFVALPKGCFQMGSTAKALEDINPLVKRLGSTLIADEHPRHEVCVDAFFMGQTEVRASHWHKVMGKNPPAGSDKAPAGGLQFAAAQEFARRLTALSKGRYQFRLPTEAEWEYACRAGDKQESQPYDGERVAGAWYSESGLRTQQPSAVARLPANAWGLHDMLGNVWEWVADGYQANGYAKHGLYNPLQQEAQNGERVIRGASHRSEYMQVRCANRASYPAAETLDVIGLRLVRQP